MGIIAPPLGPVQLPQPTGEATTDTENIANYIKNAGPKKQLELQAGQYLVNKIRLTKNQKLNGKGKGITEVKLANGQNVDVIANAAEGEEYITISNMTIDGNKANQAGTKNHHGIHLIQSGNSILENIEAQNVDGHGVSLDGNGTVTRYHQIYNIISHDNAAFGIRGTFAIRNVEYVNLLAYKNGEHGIQFDHSELVATNIEARENEGRGIFIRNVFTIVTNDFRATSNGEDGIYVQGMTYSDGNNWFAGGNSTKKANEFNEITFNGSGALSYGITNICLINNINASFNSELSKKAKHSLFIGDPEGGAVEWGDLKLFGVNAAIAETGAIRTPAEGVSAHLLITDYPQTSGNLRWYAGNGLAFPNANGFRLGTAAAHKLGLYGVTPVAQQGAIAATTNPAAFVAGANGFDTEAHAKEIRDKIEALTTEANAFRTALKNLGVTA